MHRLVIFFETIPFCHAYTNFTCQYKMKPSLRELVIVDGHGCHTALHFGIKAEENHDKVPTLYWLPKLHIKTL